MRGATYAAQSIGTSNKTRSQGTFRPQASPLFLQDFVAQSNMTVHVTVKQVKDIALVTNHDKFKKHHNGFLNVYTVENQVDCSRGIVMNKDVTPHVTSSQDLYGHLMDSISLHQSTICLCNYDMPSYAFSASNELGEKRHAPRNMADD
jgi:hypothetical protein